MSQYVDGEAGMDDEDGHGGLHEEEGYDTGDESVPSSDDSIRDFVVEEDADEEEEDAEGHHAPAATQDDDKVVKASPSPSEDLQLAQSEDTEKHAGEKEPKRRRVDKEGGGGNDGGDGDSEGDDDGDDGDNGDAKETLEDINDYARLYHHEGNINNMSRSFKVLDGERKENLLRLDEYHLSLIHI